MRRVAVVGAGVAGLATAHAIRRDAAKQNLSVGVTVLEAGPRAGGRIRTTRDGGWLVEWAANAIQSTGGVAGTGSAARHLAEELGLGSECVAARPDAARRYIARGGRLHRVPSDPMSFLTFGALSPGSRLRVLAEPIAARRVSRDETVHAYAARHLGEEAAVALVGSVTRGVFAGDARRLSLDAAFPIMREMERKHRSLVLAMMARAKDAAARRGTWSLRGGMERLIDALARPLGDALRLRTPILALERREEAGYVLQCANGERIEADVVVVAAPAKSASSLLHDLDPDTARGLDAVPSTSVAVVALGFRADVFQWPPDGYGFLVAPDDPLEVLGAVFESNLFPERAPEGHVLVRVLMGGAERPDLVTRRDDELVALAMKALDRTLGLKSGPERTWVHRQSDAIPQYQVGHRTMMGGIAKRLDSLPGLFLTGNAYRGVSVGSLIEDAERTAARLVRRL